MEGARCYGHCTQGLGEWQAKGPRRAARRERTRICEAAYLHTNRTSRNWREALSGEVLGVAFKPERSVRIRATMSKRRNLDKKKGSYKNVADL